MTIETLSEATSIAAEIKARKFCIDALNDADGVCEYRSHSGTARFPKAIVATVREMCIDAIEKELAELTAKFKNL